jgi:serine/threonine-protein kinase
VAPRDTRLPLAAAAAAAPLATGLLQLAISPWGHVDVDGTAAGTTPPLTRLNLPEGSHTITVRNEDFAPYTTTVQVSADKPVTVRHRFGQ